MRGQVSLELFFALSLFVLMLFWMNHFLGVASDASSSASNAALRSSVLSLEAEADAACLSQASVQVPSPCLSWSGTPLAIQSAGHTLQISGVSVATRCFFENDSVVAYACGSPVCAAPYANGTYRWLGGACP